MRRIFLSLIAAGLVGNAFAADPKASRYYEDALKRYEKNDMAGAVIQLKNVLQIDNRMLAAHLLMGKALLQTGDLPAAEAAFEEALRLGVSRAEVLLPLAQVYLLQGKYETLLERVTTEGLPPLIQADVLVARANAQSERGNRVAATRLLEEAKALDANSLKVRLAQATLLIRSGDLGQATAITDDAIRMYPNDATAWNTRASILHLKNDIPGALAAYAKSLSLNPKYADARIARAGLLIDVGRFDDADREVKELQEVAPDDPRAAYLRSVIAANRGDTETVKRSLNQIVDFLDPVPPNVLAANRQMLFLVGLAHFGLANQEKALDYLSAYLRQYPGDPGATKLLASLHLERGDRTRVISLLEPLLRSAPNDPRALSLLASAYMQERNYRMASELLDRAVKLSGSDAGIRTDFGLSLMGSGRSDSGLEQLQQVFLKDPKQSRAALALATLYLKSGQAKRAQEVIETLIKNDQGNLTALNMLGIIRLAAGDRPGARKAFDQVVAKDAGYQAAILNLARIDIAEGKPAAARSRLDNLLRSDAKNIEAMAELASIEEKAGNATEAIRWLEKVRDEPTGAVRGAIMLAALHMRLGSPDKALAVAKDAVAKAPDNLVALASLIQAQLALGDRRGARQTLVDMTRYANYDPDAQLEVAKLQMAAGNDSGAIYSLDKALSSRPAYLPALALYAEIHIAKKDFAKAEQRIKIIGDTFPASHLTTRLQGDLTYARGQYAAALGNYLAVQKKDNSPEIALRIYQAQSASGDGQKGLGLLEKWSRDNPNHLAVLRTIAEAHLRARNLTAARTAFEHLLKLLPDDPYTLNNLAQTALRQNDKAALGFAERAYAVRPNDPVVIDTLGWVLVRSGQLDRGLAYLRDARLRHATDPEIRYHLAAALQQSGRRTEAREELDYALQSGVNFDGIDEARKLKQELSKQP